MMEREKKKILVVDDEQAVLEFLQQLLGREERFAVMTASDGEEGLRTAVKWLPDLILLDVGLPNMSGGEVAAALRRDTRTCDIPVCFLTGLVREGELQEDRPSYKSSCFMLSKSVKPSKIVRTIDQLLNDVKNN